MKIHFLRILFKAKFCLQDLLFFNKLKFLEVLDL